ncbi:hypothetical protein Kfla_3801 [Kribbella flavida DSM 17836]|uniref:Secreted protein n=1 Tax=Kribbella flavida (strain DSM 17836 / JCM 10339 / NBRC 14399) TaxID=479435 RepID=D2PPT0_KRIFD|nr:hypothetical protein [Kribbella flavida]ADB32854.1 hypothetical protein Kfla_3801 [Kribbella flavida DSM 17836]
MRRHLVPTALTATAVTGLVTLTLVAGAPTGNAADRPSSAYAIGADGQVPVQKTPYVESRDGRQRSSSALELPKNALVSARAATVTAGNDKAAVELLDVTVGRGALSTVKLPPELKKSCASLPAQGAGDLPVPDLPLPDLGLPLPGLSTGDLPVKNLPALCDLLLTPPASLLGIDSINVWCAGDRGGVDLGSLTLLGQRIQVPTTEQGATIPAAPLATITVNDQAERSDGSFTVTGLTINLGDGAQVIRLASATCAKPAARPTPTPEPTDPPRPTMPPETEHPPAAPVPSPIKTHHPVTG